MNVSYNRFKIVLHSLSLTWNPMKGCNCKESREVLGAGISHSHISTKFRHKKRKNLVKCCNCKEARKVLGAGNEFSGEKTSDDDLPLTLLRNALQGCCRSLCVTFDEL